MGSCAVTVAVLAVLLVLHSLLELHYFLRSLLTVLLAAFCKKRRHILDTLSVTGLCLTSDIDTLLYHMNNARYMREVDFARLDFYQRTGLLAQIIAKGGSVVQAASSIRYRRFIRPFSIFRVESKIVYWDDSTIFMEHRFVSPSDNFVRAIVLCRQRLIDCNAEDVMAELLARSNNVKEISSPCPAGNGCSGGVANPAVVIEMEPEDKNPVSLPTPPPTTVRNAKPSMPLEVAKWIESIEISSANLRNGC